MRTLALEFSTAVRSVAVCADAEVRGRETQAGRADGAELGLVSRVLRRASVEVGWVDTFVVGLGPGSYVGIRSALALAQGWRMARGVRVLGLSTVACLLAQAEALAIQGMVGVVIDAQRGEYYLACYEMGSGRPVERQALRLVSAGEIEAVVAGGARLIGPEGLAAGWDLQVCVPDAGVLGRLVAQGGCGWRVEQGELEPIYLRQAGFVKARPTRCIPP